MSLITGILITVFASLIITKACDGFEAAADYLGRNMSEGIKGATINAIGSSMPELWVTFIYLFVYKNTTGFSGGLGTTAGSAIFNAMVIPAFVILSVVWKSKNTSIRLSKIVILRDGLTLICAELFLILFFGDILTWHHGFFLIMIYFFYASWMIYRHKKNGDNGNTQKNKKQTKVKTSSRVSAFFKIDLQHAVTGKNSLVTKNAVLLLFVSILFIAFACWLLVYSCEAIGESLHLHGFFIAVVLAAIASSIPDTILSIKDGKKGNYNDAMANALGSNIFDICFVLGVPLLIYVLFNGPLVIAQDAISYIVELRLLLLFLTIITVFIFLLNKEMTKITAIILISMYLFFIIYVVGRAYELRFITAIAEKLHAIQAFIQ